MSKTPQPSMPPKPCAGTALNAACTGAPTTAAAAATKGVYVKGLGDASTATVMKLFTSAGAVTDVRLRRHRFALVFFKRAAAATKAIGAFHNKVVHGKRLLVASAHAGTDRRERASVASRRASGRSNRHKRAREEDIHVASSSASHAHTADNTAPVLVSPYAAACLEAIPATDQNSGTFTAHRIDIHVAITSRLPHAVVPQLVAEHVVGPYVYSKPDWVVVGVTRTGARAAVVVSGDDQCTSDSARQVPALASMVRSWFPVRGYPTKLSSPSMKVIELSALLCDLASAWPPSVRTTPNSSPFVIVATLWCNLFATDRMTQALALHALADVCTKAATVRRVLCTRAGRDLVFLPLAEDVVDGSAVVEATCCCPLYECCYYDPCRCRMCKALFSGQPAAELGCHDDAALKQASVADLARAFQSCTEDGDRSAFTNARFRDGFLLRLVGGAWCSCSLHWIASSSHGLLGFMPFNVTLLRSHSFWSRFFVTMKRKMERQCHEWPSVPTTVSAASLLESLAAWNHGRYQLRCFCSNVVEDDAYTCDLRFAKFLFAVFDLSCFPVTKLIDTFGLFVLCYDNGAYLTDAVPWEYVVEATKECEAYHFLNDAMVEYLASAVRSAEESFDAIISFLFSLAVPRHSRSLDYCGTRRLPLPIPQRLQSASPKLLRPHVMRWNETVHVVSPLDSSRAVEGIVIPMLHALDGDRRRLYHKLSAGQLYSHLTHRIWHPDCPECARYFALVQ